MNKNDNEIDKQKLVRLCREFIFNYDQTKDCHEFGKMVEYYVRELESIINETNRARNSSTTDTQ
jgi:hypothetical protein